jgi:DNA-directed RNA polymerase subunit F
MIGKELISEEIVPIPLVKKILKKRDSEEMIYEQKIALEHAEKFSRLKLSDAEQLVKELKELGFRVRDDAIVKIADILPTDEVDIKAIMLQSGTQLKKEQSQKILDIVAKYKA